MITVTIYTLSGAVDRYPAETYDDGLNLLHDRLAEGLGVMGGKVTVDGEVLARSWNPGFYC